MSNNTEASEKLNSIKTITIVMYVLTGLSLVSGGFLGIVAIIVNYVKKDDAVGTIYESHFQWLRNTIWIGLVLGIAGFLLVFAVIGFLVLPALGIWVLYRVIKGFLRFNDGKPMYGDAIPGTVAQVL